MASEPLARLDAIPIGTSVGARFEAVAREHAGRVAIGGTLGARMTYGELDRRANAVARAIAELPRTAGGPVALLAEASPALFAAMLGALKAGRPYAPLDVRLPPARLREILSDLAPAVIAADAPRVGLARELSEGLRSVWILEEIASAAADGAAPAAAVSPDAPAYVLFTSGTTGRPKGVVQSHRGVLHNAAKLASGLRLTPDDRLTLLGSPALGASVSDIFGALLTGACVCPFSLAGDGLRRLPEFLASERITISHSVPSVFRTFAAALAGSGADLSRLRLVKLGGESVTASDFDLFRRHFPRGAVFHVGLGMTEASVVRQWFADHDTVWPGNAPLGYAVDATEVVLRDDAGRDGAEEGEIVVRSPTLALGYWNDPERTAAAFVPVLGRPGWRSFRTGDRGRMRPDGFLFYLGRGDARVKVRGHRVEPAEVEAVLASAPGVREVAVAGREGAEGSRLVAWIAREAPGRPGTPQLRRAVAERLPDYMVPGAFVFVPSLPRTPAGKVDRAALPEPTVGRRDVETEFLAPRDETEQTVARVFADVLALDRVGARDDFFELGGSSLSAVRAVAALADLFGGDLEALDLIEAPTPEGLARRLREGKARPAEPIGVLHRAASGLPVFLVPGGSGDGEDLFVNARLARRVGPEFSFLGLRSGPPPHPPLAALARRHVERLRERQPRGPYRIVGECVGGLLALEMARRLRRQGQTVSLLALLDTPFPSWSRRLRQTLWPLRAPWGDNLFRRLRHHARALAGLDPAARRRYLAEKATVAARALAGSRGRRQPRLDRKISYVSRLLAARPGRQDGRVFLFQSEEGRREGLAAAWSRVLPNLEVATGPGDHASYILENVDCVADALRAWLKDSEPSP